MAIVKELPLVPAERALKVIGGRWKVFILFYLFRGPRRLSELRRLIPNVSQKVLVHQLREMEEHGIVDREVFAEVPPRVVYTATKLGLSLRPIIDTLCEWGNRHADELGALEKKSSVERSDDERPAKQVRRRDKRAPPDSQGGATGAARATEPGTFTVLARRGGARYG